MDYKTARGWLTDKEREALKWYAKRIAPGNPLIVNIGVEYGASVVCLKTGSPHGIILAVDIDISKCEAGPIAYYIQSDSGKLVSDWVHFTRGKTVDLLFIDGDHSYEGVAKDLVWTWWVRPNGVVIFHDCFEWPPEPPRQTRQVCPGVNKAVQQWADINVETFEELEEVDSMRIFVRTQ